MYRTCTCPSFLAMDNFSMQWMCDVSSGVHSQSTSPLQSIHIVVSLNCAHRPVAPFMLIKQIWKKRTLLGKQRGERSVVITCQVWKIFLVRVAPLEMDANSRPSTSAASEPVSVELAEADILGASLNEPLDMHNVAILRWWLQCHGI